MGWGPGLLSAYDTGTVGIEATANSVLWLGWRQVHEQRLKLYPCALALEYYKRAGCVTVGARLLGTAGWCGGERED